MCLGHFPCHGDTIVTQFKGREFVLAHTFSPQVASSKAGRSGGKGLVEESCSPYGSQEAQKVQGEAEKADSFQVLLPVPQLF